MGWMLPRDVQDEAIPLILGGGDVMIAAETGSGKTGAFALPLLQIVYETLRGKAKSDAVPDAAPSAGSSSAAAAAAAAASARLALNPKDRQKYVAIAEDGLLCQSREERRWGGCRANHGFTKGKVYYEATVTDEGLCRFGYSTARARYDVGTDQESWGFGGTGKKSYGRAFDPYGESFGLNDVMGCMLDLDAHTISFSKNGRDFGVAFDIPSRHHGKPLFPSVTLKNAEMRFNFGEKPFKHAPAGYTAASAMPADAYEVFEPQARGSKNDRSGTSSEADLRKFPLALIIEPTKELARQVCDELDKFKAPLQDPPITHMLLTGGGAKTKQIMAELSRGVNIIVATPGKLMDFVKTKKLNLSECRYLVLDEADSLLSDGHQKDILTVYEEMANGDHGLQVVVASATLHSPQIRGLCEKICFHPIWVDLKGKDSVPESVDHAVILVDPRNDRTWQDPKKRGAVPLDHVHDKDPLPKGKQARQDLSPEQLSLGVKVLKPYLVKQIIDTYEMDQAMIFCRTQVDCDNLEEFLVTAGGGRKYAGGDSVNISSDHRYACTVLHSGKNSHREENMAAFKSGVVKFLICTDVAARGIDVAGLPYVINVTLPQKAEDYIHRVGRVGRADNVGLAISIVSPVAEKVWWHTCNRSDRGRGCRKTKLVDQGGCTIWFNEADVLREVEQRLGGIEVGVLDPDNLIEGREEFVKSAAAGRLNQDAAALAMQQQVESFVLPTAQELAALEVQAQHTFLGMQQGAFWNTQSNN